MLFSWSARQLVFGHIFLQDCLFKNTKYDLSENAGKYFAELLLTSAIDSRNIAAVWNKSRFLFNHLLNGTRYKERTTPGEVMNSVIKFYLGLTLLWCLTVGFSTTVKLTFRKCFGISVVCALRQPLHWAGPGTGAQWHWLLVCALSSAWCDGWMEGTEWRSGPDCVSPQSPHCQYKPGQAKTNRRKANKSLSLSEEWTMVTSTYI